jgi:hypothetical protein
VEKGLGRHASGEQIGRQLGRRHLQPDGSAVAPAAHVQDDVARRKAVHCTFDDFADRPASHRLV